MKLVVESSQEKIDRLYDALLNNDFEATVCKKDEQTLKLDLYEYQLGVALNCIQSVLCKKENEKHQSYPIKIIYPQATVYIDNDVIE